MQNLENGKVIFKCIKNDNNKKLSIKSYINKLHVDYIATRPGTDLGENEHGLFGYIQGTENVENINLEDIKKYVQDMSNQKVDITKSIISLREEDAIYKGVISKETWKCMLKDRVRGIAEEYNIEFQNFEWIASYHMEKGHPHTHLVFWDKSQLIEQKKKQYVNFKNIRKNIAKGIFKEELDSLYEKQNEYKKNISTDIQQFNRQFKVQEELMLQIKEEMPSIYNNPILNNRFVDSGIEKINNNLNELKNKIKNYRYKEQTKEVKKLIDDTSYLILNSSRDCFNTYVNYIKTNIKIGEILAQTDTTEQLQNVKNKAEDYLLNKIGNQILKFLKTEEFNKQKKEELEQKLKKYEEKRILNENEYLEEQINYLEGQFKSNTTRMFSEIFQLLNQENISSEGKYGRLRAKYSNLSKQAKREKYLEQKNTSGIDWFVL